MFLGSVVALALLVASVSGQNSTNSTIDPTSIDPVTRADWCRGQLSTCGILCQPGGNTDTGNTCDDTALTFVCTCAANNSSPGLQYYTDTMPTFECEELFTRCIANNVNSQTAQDKCKADELANCGHNNPAKFVPPVSSASSSASSTPTAASGGSATTSASSSSSTGAAATMLAIGGEYGSGIVAAGVAAAFGLML